MFFFLISNVSFQFLTFECIIVFISFFSDPILIWPRLNPTGAHLCLSPWHAHSLHSNHLQLSCAPVAMATAAMLCLLLPPCSSSDFRRLSFFFKLLCGGRETSLTAGWRRKAACLHARLTRRPFERRKQFKDERRRRLRGAGTEPRAYRRLKPPISSSEEPCSCQEELFCLTAAHLTVPSFFSQQLPDWPEQQKELSCRWHHDLLSFQPEYQTLWLQLESRCQSGCFKVLERRRTFPESSLERSARLQNAIVSFKLIRACCIRGLKVIVSTELMKHSSWSGSVQAFL